LTPSWNFPNSASTYVDGGFLRDRNYALVTSGGPTVSVTAYGATGDGTTDDTTAIQTAINTLSSGGTVFIPNGTYKLTAALTVANDDIVIAGEGYGSKLQLAAGSNSNVILVNPSADTATNGIVRKNRVILRDLYVDHNGINQTGTGTFGGAVAAPEVNHFEAHRVYVTNAKGVGFDTRGASVLKFVGCTVDNVYWAGAANGFNAVGLTGNITGTDCVMTGCTVIGVPDVGFWVGGSNAHRVTLQGCVARADARRYFADGAITSGTTTFTSATATFTKQDEGKAITINGAGAAGRRSRRGSRRSRTRRPSRSARARRPPSRARRSPTDRTTPRPGRSPTRLSTSGFPPPRSPPPQPASPRPT
jgi:hypothetical protein